MNPYVWMDDDDNDKEYENLLNLLTSGNNDNQQPISPTKITNFNQDNMQQFNSKIQRKDNQEHLLFKQNMKQSQQIFQRKLEKLRETRKTEHKDQNFQNQQNQDKLKAISPILFNNQEKQTMIPFPYSPKFYQQKQKQKLITIKEISNTQANITHSNTLQQNICSACQQPKGVDHQCNDEFGLILCPYCSDHIVRNFAKDHFVECIPYIEQQFQTLEQVSECTICMLELITDKQTLHCGHSFHKSCIDEWLKKKKECPFCRKPI